MRFRPSGSSVDDDAVDERDADAPPARLARDTKTSQSQAKVTPSVTTRA